MSVDRCSHLEAAIKRVITKQYKLAFGKGPDETRVRISDNVVVIRFEGALTSIEESLLGTSAGAQLVADVRRRMVHEKKEDYVPYLEEVVGEKVQEVSFAFNDKTNEMYLFLIFSVDLCY